MCELIQWKGRLRSVAETNATRRQDALNLANLHVRRYLENVFENEPPLLLNSFWSKLYKFVGLAVGDPIPNFLQNVGRANISNGNTKMLSM